MKSTFLLQKVLKSWFHEFPFAWSRFIELFHTVWWVLIKHSNSDEMLKSYNPFKLCTLFVKDSNQRKNSWNWIFLLSVIISTEKFLKSNYGNFLKFDFTEKFVKLNFPTFFKVASTKNSWINWVMPLFLKLISVSQKNSWNNVMQLFLKLISRKNWKINLVHTL